MMRRYNIVKESRKREQAPRSGWMHEGGSVDSRRRSFASDKKS